MTNSFTTALLLREAGASAIPVKSDKRPLIKWKDYQHRLPTDAELKDWFSRDAGIALCAGKIQCLDFDEKYSRGIFPRFVTRAEEVGLDYLIGELVRQRTPSGGFHLVWSCDGKLIGNEKLASRPATNKEKQAAAHVKEFSMIETRGDGGYFLISPSPGYVLESGDWSSIPVISEEDRDALLSLARSFDERAPVEIGLQEAPDDFLADAPPIAATPGDDYDAKADIPALLRQHGWKSAGSSGKYWTRPGKAKGISASWGVVPNRLFVFSSSTEFQPNHVYRPWHIYAILECGGDFARAAGELRRAGYGGTEPKTKKQAEIIDFLSEPPAVEAYDEPPGVESAPPCRGEGMTVWTPQQFFDYKPDSHGDLLGDGFITKGEWTTLLGVGGLGKSRLALWLCICQMTGQDWCGIKTAGVPKKTLFLSTENGVVRWKKDLSMMFSTLTGPQKQAVQDHLVILALTPDEEGDLNLGQIENVKRIVATLQNVGPEFIVLDPFADMVDGDENSTSDLVKTLGILRGVHRRGAPSASVLIIHHARTGANNVAQAGDNYSAGNFGRGSKALYSKVRCELQLAPGSRDNPNLLVLACGKSNNAEKFSPRGLVFDPETFTYAVDPTFDVDIWRSDVAGKMQGKKVSEADAVLVVTELVKGGAGPAAAIDVVTELMKVTTAKDRACKTAISAAVRGGYLAKTKHGHYTLGIKPLRAA